VFIQCPKKEIWLTKHNRWLFDHRISCFWTTTPSEFPRYVSSTYEWIAKCSVCDQMFQLPAVRDPIPPQPKVSRIINSITLSYNLYEIIFFRRVCFPSIPPAVPHITHVPIKAWGSVPLQAPSHSYPDTTTGSTWKAHRYRLHAVA